MSVNPQLSVEDKRVVKNLSPLPRLHDYTYLSPLDSTKYITDETFGKQMRVDALLSAARMSEFVTVQRYNRNVNI